MKHSNLKSFIEELIKEVETELDEATTTASVDGYNTPNAFSDGGSKDKKRKKKISTQFGMKIVGKMDESFLSDLDLIKKGSKDITDFVKKVLSNKDYKEVRNDKEFHKYLKSFYNESVVNESKSKRPVNRWLELKNDETMHPHKKMAIGLKELKYQLAETEKFFTWYNKIKTMNELDSSEYWKRTQSHIYKIKERLINIAKTIQEIEK
jgi:hypothetical protein